MATGPVIRRNVFLMVKEDLTKLTSELSLLQGRIKYVQARIEACQQIIAEFKGDVCSQCNGSGEVTIQYAQDDIKFEICDRCKGSGLPTTGGLNDVRCKKGHAHISIMAAASCDQES